MTSACYFNGHEIFLDTLSDKFMRAFVSIVVKAILGSIVLYSIARMIILAYDYDNLQFERWHVR